MLYNLFKERGIEKSCSLEEGKEMKYCPNCGNPKMEEGE